MPIARTDIDDILASLRPRLLAFSRLQLRSAAAAEDVVQEALLAAMQGADQFAGAAAFQTWVFSILKHKIIDELRRNQRLQTESEPDTALENAVDSLFDQREHWNEPPARWADPHASLEQKRFWEVLDACLTGLPTSTARVFMMREFLELATTEICESLSITSSNCWVLLHRARLGLRECLGLRWFGEIPA